MHKRNCGNCETTWHSVPDHELEAPHTCPRCGDALVSLHELPVLTGPAAAAHTLPLAA
jgi:uncharacterized paraquat-inducible protein A